MESNFQKDLQESEFIFKKMFDPNSVLFHNGDPTPVPIGGQRIPSSMPTPYKIEETIEKKIEYGPEYEHHQEMREFFNLVKKTLAKLTPPIEAIIRHKEVFNTSANPSLPAHINKFKKNLEIEQEKIKSVIQELADMRERMGNYNDYKEKLTKILDGALVEFKDKDEYTTYSFEVKNFSKDLFKEMGILLEKMKLIKKEKEGVFNKENNLNVVAGKEEFKKN